MLADVLWTLIFFVFPINRWVDLGLGIWPKTGSGSSPIVIIIELDSSGPTISWAELPVDLSSSIGSTT